jgi:NAD(P)-dependent dehydrogenase (short-subunit alcohol dehydrogenase family)
MAVNVRGVFLCIKHDVPLMLATAGNEGSIVITSSTAGAVSARLRDSCLGPYKGLCEAEVV